MKKTIILIRGVPGSGKSTYAASTSLMFFEADDYFIRPDGVYDFNPHLLKNAHDLCFNKVEQVVIQGFSSCCVANTFARLWEMKQYIDLAEKYGYDVLVIRCSGTYQNLHGVPQDKVDQMKERFEDYQGELIV